jgi:DNA-binding transcriptional ArsR family regulator
VTDDADAPTAERLRAAAAVFDMLSVPTRLHLMWLLCQGERDVGALAADVGATVAAVSQHLAKLRLAGLVSARREGRYQVYSADDPHLLMLVEQVFEYLEPAEPPGPTTGEATRRRPRAPLPRRR